MNAKITVYTPTFNRGYCLHQLYESLCRQTTKHENYEWLIVDDGSTDNTQELVMKWKDNANFKITYYKQKNEGKMAKLNFIHKIIETEFCMNVDSDDYLVDDAIERILSICNIIRDQEDIAGIVGLNNYPNGEIVGTKFPSNIKRIKFSNFDKLGVKGDKKFIYKTKTLNKYPEYPSIDNERFPAPGYLYRLIDVDYDLYSVNDTFCIVEYLDDGLSKNKYKQFINAPNSWMFYRKERIRLSSSLIEKYRNSAHYVSSCIFAKKSIFKDNPYRFLSLIALPMGLLLNLYIRKTNRKGVVK